MKPDKQALPYFRMYASVILADTNFNGLSDSQTGWYFRLMLESWFRAGFLPDDDETLRTLAGSPRRDRWENYKRSVLFFFDKHEHEGQPVLVNAGLRAQWLKANESYDHKVNRKLLAGQKALPKKQVVLQAGNLMTRAQVAKALGKTVEQITEMQNRRELPGGTHINTSSLRAHGVSVE